MESAEILIVIALFVVAVLYSSVGHGGASGYLAVMALFAIQSDITRPTALILNVFVSSIAFLQFYRAKHFDWRVFLPFAVTSFRLLFWAEQFSLPNRFIKLFWAFV